LFKYDVDLEDSPFTSLAYVVSIKFTCSLSLRDNLTRVRIRDNDKGNGQSSYNFKKAILFGTYLETDYRT